MTKSERLLLLLQTRRGRTSRELAAALGWRPASVRGAISRLRLSGAPIETVQTRPHRYACGCRGDAAPPGGSDRTLSRSDEEAARRIGLLR